MNENTNQKVLTLAQMIAAHQKSHAEVAALKTQVETLAAAGGEPNVITAVNVNGTAAAITDKAVNITVPTKASDLTNDAGYQTSAQVETAINAKISSAYKAAGSVAFADLPVPSAETLGNVYNVTNKFTTEESFIGAAGEKYPAGTNVLVVKTGDTYGYDVLAGFVDLSGYETAEQSDTKLAGKVDKEDGKGLSTNDYTTAEKEKLAGIVFATDAEVTAALNEIYGA